MKQFLLAAAIALGSVSAPVTEVSAATVTITGDAVQISHRDHRDRHWNHHRKRHHRVHCRVKRVKIWRHHHLVVKKVRVCR